MNSVMIEKYNSRQAEIARLESNWTEQDQSNWESMFYSKEATLQAIIRNDSSSLYNQALAAMALESKAMIRLGC